MDVLEEFANFISTARERPFLHENHQCLVALADALIAERGKVERLTKAFVRLNQSAEQARALLESWWKEE